MKTLEIRMLEDSVLSCIGEFANLAEQNARFWREGDSDGEALADAETRCDMALNDLQKVFAAEQPYWSERVEHSVNAAISYGTIALEERADDTEAQQARNAFELALLYIQNRKG
jgi:hypothetical protein